MRIQLEFVGFFSFKEQRPGHRQVKIKLQRKDDRYRLIAKIQ